MTNSTSQYIGAMRIEELIDRISSPDVTPGAGAAGAVALALAAACAGKAVAVSLKHAPQDPELKDALAVLSGIARAALTDADQDSVAFRDFMKTGTAAASQQLILEGASTARLIYLFASQMERIGSETRPNMAGDLVAAKSLLHAARVIQETNQGEALRHR